MGGLGFEGLECQEEGSEFRGKGLKGKGVEVAVIFEWSVVFLLFLFERFDEVMSHFFEFFISLQVLQ